MELSFRLLTIFAILTATLGQHEPQIAPQSPPQASQIRSTPLGARYSAATDVSHVSFNSPLVTYGSSLNEIQLPAAPIQPANLRQVPQEDNSVGDTLGEEQHTLVRSSGNQGQSQPPAQQVTQNQISHAVRLKPTSNQQQFISIQQYPAGSQLQSTPQSFSLSQDLPGAQPQAAVRHVPQYSPLQNQPLVQQPQYATEDRQQFTVAHPQQYALPQQQYSSISPLNVAQQQTQVQYPSPVAYSSPSSNAYFATGPFAAQYPTSNLIARQPVHSVAAQYAQSITSPYTQPIVSQYAQPLASQYSQSQYIQQVPNQSAQPVALQQNSQLVSRVAFNGPVGSFSYGF